MKRISKTTLNVFRSYCGTSLTSKQMEKLDAIVKYSVYKSLPGDSFRYNFTRIPDLMYINWNKTHK